VVPSVIGEDGFVECLMHEVQPSGALVVEVRQRVLLELLLTFLVFEDDARIADGANAVIVAFSEVF